MIYQKSCGHQCFYNTNLLDTYKVRRNFQCSDITRSFKFPKYNEHKLISNSYKYFNKVVNLKKFTNRRIGYWQTREISAEFLIYLKNYYGYKTQEGILIHIRGTDFLQSEDQIKRHQAFYLTNLKRAQSEAKKIHITTDDLNFAVAIIGSAGIDQEKVTYLQTFNECLGFNEVVSSESTYSTWAALISGSKLIFPEKTTSVLMQNKSIQNLVNKNEVS